MNSILFNLAMLALMLVVAHANDNISNCDGLSQNLAKHGQEIWPSKLEVALEYVKKNFPSQNIISHIGYVKRALKQPDGLAPKKNYRIDRELKDEQAAWLAKAEEKVSDYYFELASILDKPEKLTGEAIEYPSSESIDSLLKEVDENDDGSLSKNPWGYFWTHNTDRGVVKFLEVMFKPDKKQQ